MNNVSFAYNKNDLLLEDISLTFPAGKITGILGPNGSGKSTMIQLLARKIKPIAGSLQLAGKDYDDYSRKQFARSVAFLGQKNQFFEDVTVERFVSYGRLPYQRVSKGSSKEDLQIVRESLEMCDLADRRDDSVLSLSGGQLQRVFIALALAQTPDYLLLDEPTTYLDIKYQMELLAILKRINAEQGTTVIMVIHDMNQAALICDNLVLVKSGQILTQGTPEEVITTANLQAAFEMNCKVMNVDGMLSVWPQF